VTFVTSIKLFVLLNFVGLFPFGLLEVFKDVPEY